MRRRQAAKGGAVWVARAGSKDKPLTGERGSNPQRVHSPSAHRSSTKLNPSFVPLALFLLYSRKKLGILF